MTPLDALRQAVLECQQFPYRAEKPGSDLWQSPKETEHYCNGDCEDAAIWTIIRTWALTEGAELFLVAGVLEGGVGHAWVELVEGAETWGGGARPGRGRAGGGRRGRGGGPDARMGRARPPARMVQEPHTPLRIPLDREPVPRQVRLREGRVTVVERWLLRTVAVALLLAAVYVTAREMADWIIWRRDVNAEIQQLSPRLAAPPPATPAPPGANGLDTGAQTTAFYNLYYIWNGTTLATVASLADASAGPSLPSGYTFWAWATTIRSTASLANSYVRGCQVYWQEARQLIINSTGTGETTVSVATLTAPNAKSTALFLDAASGGGTSTTFLRLVTGVNFMQASRYAAAGGFNAQVWLPNVAQTFLYQRGAGDAFDIWHAGYGFCDD